MKSPPPLLGAALVFMLSAALPGPAAATQVGPRPLDHDDFGQWHRIQTEAISPDGSWVAYVVVAADGTRRLHLRGVADEGRLELAHGDTPVFTDDSRFLLVRISPPADPGAPGASDTLALVDLARLRSAPDRPREAVGLEEGLLSFEVAAEGAPRIAYRTGSLSSPTLVLRDLTSGAGTRVRGVLDHRLSSDGRLLWYVREDARGDDDGVYRMDTATGAITRVMVQEGRYAALTLSPDGRAAAFLAASDPRGAPVWRLHVALEAGRLRTVVGDGAPELPGGWRVSGTPELRFSDSGARLFFGAVPPTGLRTTADVDPDVIVDVWSWTDPYLQPMQKARAREERERDFRAVAHLDGGGVVVLEQPGEPELYEPVTGDEPMLLARTDEPYRPLLSWDGRYVDVFLVDPLTGGRTGVLERIRGDARLSPTGRWITWWDGAKLEWRGLEVATGLATSLSAGIPFPVHDELHDRPSPSDPYGFAGWTPGDARALVYDRHDLWQVDPAGREPPLSLTEGVGRREGLRFRLAERAAPPEVEEVDGAAPSAAATASAAGHVAASVTGPLLLAALDLDSRDAGFWLDAGTPEAEPRRLVMSPHRWGVPARAESGRLLLTRESFSQYPDLWVADEDFAQLERVSDANPQQARFRWGSEELVSWTGADGTPLRGILYRPQDHDPTRPYPLIVQLYERPTQDFHRYHDPAPGGSSINRSFYVSRGYLVLAPDIAYRVGEPGESVVDAVVPAVRALIDAGLVDPARIGVQGHSWGGWETAYLLTRTDLFAAAVAGAPVANMTSAYGGVRWGSGMSRMFQYEQEQSRIGASLWEAADRYVENSPLFSADRIRTPLLVLHNDEDTAVPWEQGIELFSALRRLGKPSWMVNYNGEAHALRKAANRRDWAIRMQQFFDHWLLGEPAPVWMIEGIPARMKGRTLGLDLVEGEGRPVQDGAAAAGTVPR